MKPFVQCRNCPRRAKGGPATNKYQPGAGPVDSNGYNTDWVSIPALGYYFDTDSYGNKIIKECDCHKKWRKDQEFEGLAEAANIATTITLDDYVGEKSRTSLKKLQFVAKNAETFKDKVLYVWGPNGCQKTTMVKALGVELLKQGKTVYMTYMSELVSNLVNDFNLSGAKEQLRNKYIETVKNADFLIIDEVFDQYKYNVSKSGYEIGAIDTFFRSRIERDHKNIILISNTDPDKIVEHYGNSMQSLISRNIYGTTLYFEDNYMRSNKVPVMNLFEDIE